VLLGNLQLAKAWHKAVLANSPFAYKTFADNYSSSPYAKSALHLQAAPKAVPLMQFTHLAKQSSNFRPGNFGAHAHMPMSSRIVTLPARGMNANNPVHGGFSKGNMGKAAGLPGKGQSMPGNFGRNGGKFGKVSSLHPRMHNHPMRMNKPMMTRRPMMGSGPHHFGGRMGGGGFSRFAGPSRGSFGGGEFGRGFGGGFGRR
jgi:hypothetical protein